MKRTVLLLLSFYVSLYSLELIPQKIMLCISKESPNFKMELIIQNQLLSKSTSKRDIYFFSDDEIELSGYGISQVNAKILLSLRDEENFYDLILSEVTKETNVLTNITFSKGSFIKELDLIVDNVLNILLTKYPPKEKKKLVTIETKKKKVSEFQKEKPTFSVNAGFNFDRFKLFEFDISSQYGPNAKLEKETVYSFAPSIKLEFEYMWFLVSFTGRISIAEDYNYYFSFVPAFGVFGNLFFIGPLLEFDGGRLNGFETNFMLTNTTIFFTFPSVEYYRLLLGFYLRINATKNYYFSLGFGFPLLGGVSLLFEERIVMEFNEGSPSINMDFNFRLIEKLFLSFQIRFSENDMDFKDLRVGTFNSTDFYLETHVSDTAFGLGVKYEF